MPPREPAQLGKHIHPKRPDLNHISHCRIVPENQQSNKHEFPSKNFHTLCTVSHPLSSRPAACDDAQRYTLGSDHAFVGASRQPRLCLCCIFGNRVDSASTFQIVPCLRVDTWYNPFPPLYAGQRPWKTEVLVHGQERREEMHTMAHVVSDTMCSVSHEQ